MQMPTGITNFNDKIRDNYRQRTEFLHTDKALDAEITKQCADGKLDMVGASAILDEVGLVTDKREYRQLAALKAELDNGNISAPEDVQAAINERVEAGQTSRMRYMGQYMRSQVGSNFGNSLMYTGAVSVALGLVGVPIAAPLYFGIYMVTSTGIDAVVCGVTD